MLGRPEAASDVRRCFLLWWLGQAAPALVAIRPFFGFFEAVRLALDGNYFGAVHQPIDE